MDFCKGFGKLKPEHQRTGRAESFDKPRVSDLEMSDCRGGSVGGQKAQGMSGALNFRSWVWEFQIFKPSSLRADLTKLTNMKRQREERSSRQTKGDC